MFEVLGYNIDRKRILNMIFSSMFEGLNDQVSSLKLKAQRFNEEAHFKLKLSRLGFFCDLFGQ